MVTYIDDKGTLTASLCKYPHPFLIIFSDGASLFVSASVLYLLVLPHPVWGCPMLWITKLAC